MKIAGLIGHPLGHTLSPRLHAAAFQSTGLEGLYVPFEVPPDRLQGAMAGMAALGLMGCNVTIPYKEAVLPLVTHRSPAVQSIGAANTLLFNSDCIEARNTDAPGFLAAWEHEVNRPLEGGRFIVLGAGGAARAILWALTQAGAAHVLLLNRDVPRAEKLAEELGQGVTQAAPLDIDRLARELVDATALINTTSAGLHPRVDESPVALPDFLRPDLVVYDLIYNPRRTRLMQEAESRGAQVYGGLFMLICQAALSFKLWTGLEPPLEALLAAVA